LTTTKGTSTGSPPGSPSGLAIEAQAPINMADGQRHSGSDGLVGQGEDNRMRIDSKALVASISSLADAQPQHDLAATLQQVVDAAKLLFGAKGAGVMLADEQGQLRWVSATDQDSQLAEDNQELLGQGPCQVAFSQRAPAMMRDARAEPDWGEISLLFSDVKIRAAASAPIELGGGPIGTLDIYAAEPRDWNQSEISALQAYAGVVASLLGSAAQAEVKGRLAEQLQVALRTRVLIEQAKGALMVHQDIDEATAFEWLRLSARSTSRTVNAVAQDILAGRWPPMPDLAAVVGRLAQARRTEQRAHQRAIDLHEQAADQHAQQGREDQAQADRDRADSARTRLQDALAEEHQASPRPG
jgi:GAF domain-containing protein